MPTDASMTNGNFAAAMDPIQLLDASRRSANLLTAGAELVTKAMGDIVAKQADFMRVEGSEIARCAAALARGSEPITTMQNLTVALHKGAEEALADLRDIQDLMRGCAWGLVGLYVESISVAAGEGRPADQLAA